MSTFSFFLRFWSFFITVGKAVSGESKGFEFKDNRAMKHLTSDNGVAEADFKEVFYFCVIWPTTDFHWRSGFQYSFCLLLVASKVGKMA